MIFKLKLVNSWACYYLPELEKKGIVHGFFTKKSPSFTFTGYDRTTFLESLSLNDLIVMEQEHGDEVHIIQNGERPKRGDGIILLERCVAGIIRTADCLPVIVAEPDFPVAAIVHAGWRGTAKRITQKAVKQMIDLGARREKMTALLGPSIRACCYEIGNEVRDIFGKEGFSEKIFTKKETSVHLDLAQANRELLAAEGIEDIYDVGLCTFCSNDTFASYRRGERSARQINFVSLKG